MRSEGDNSTEKAERTMPQITPIKEPSGPLPELKHQLPDSFPQDYSSDEWMAEMWDPYPEAWARKDHGFPFSVLRTDNLYGNPDSIRFFPPRAAGPRSHPRDPDTG